MHIQTVGISNIHYPIKVREKTGRLQDTVAAINLQVNIPRRHRQSCITLFIDVLNRYQDDLSATIFPELLTEIKQSLAAESATVEMAFPYFIEKKAPISKTKSLMEYECRFTGAITADTTDLTVTVCVPTTTLCPCSKEISSDGAHNQRAEVTLSVRLTNFVWLEDLIAMVESCASSEVFALLKRPDEKFVTEHAYANPMFVEDVVRKVAEKMLDHPDIAWFSVGVESFESIHKHSAYAYLDSDTVVRDAASSSALATGGCSNSDTKIS